MNTSPSTTVSATDDRLPSLAIIDLVSATTETDPVDLDPLYYAIDPEAIDSLCTDSPGFASLEFEYAGHTVVVARAGDEVEITLEPVTIGTGGGFADAESHRSDLRR